MNAKPDEHPDHHIRQRLYQLPDAPPPGSAFDAERLWGQLQPQLPRTTVRRRPGVVWWVAAACLSGLLLSRVWLMPQNDGIAVRTVRADTHRTSERKVTGRTPKMADKPVLAEATPMVRNQPGPRQKSSLSKLVAVNTRLVLPANAPAAADARTPESPVVTNVATPVGQPAEPASTSTTLASAAPKRRFRVMHVNELTAEEEARPKLYRTEHFVRLGTGTGQPQAATESVPALIIPFASKPNH